MKHTISTASLLWSKDGIFMRVEETTRLALMQDWLRDELFGFTSLCLREWMYHVRWGGIDPQFGFAEKSLGHLVFTLCQRIGCGMGKKSRTIGDFPVTDEWVRARYPATGWPWGRDND